MGFRYTAKYLAKSLGLQGWVRNLTDGTVEMEVCGTDSKKLITALVQKFNCTVETKNIAQNNYSGFEIR